MFLASHHRVLLRRDRHHQRRRALVRGAGLDIGAVPRYMRVWYVCIYIYIYTHMCTHMCVCTHMRVYICVSAARLIATRFRRRGGAASPHYCCCVTQCVTWSVNDVLVYFVAGAKSLARPEPCRLRGRSLFFSNYFVVAVCGAICFASSILISSLQCGSSRPIVTSLLKQEFIT